MPRQRIFGNDEVVVFSLRLPIQLKEKIQANANKKHLSLNQEIVRILEQCADLEEKDISKED